jgi:HEAT repeat protein
MSNRLREAAVTLLLVVASAFAQTPTPVADEHLQYWIRTVTSHPMKMVRKNAARVLGTMGDRTATPALVGALKDPFFGVRAEAAKSLGLLTDEKAEADLLKAAANDPDALVRRNAREAIEKIKAYQEFLKKKQEKLNRL